MEKIKTIATDIPTRLEEILETSWFIFTNQYINEKYAINLEAPFQLHFATILKLIGNAFCLKNREIFNVNLETNMFIEKNNYVDIAISLFEQNSGREYCVPIELKYKTSKQGAEDISSMEIYKDLKSLENLCYNYKKDNFEIPFAHLFFITDSQRYVKKAKTGLRTLFRTDDGYKIEKGFEYKYLKTKTGRDFFDKYGAFVFNGSYKFNWSYFFKDPNYKRWFLKVKINR